MAKKNDQPSFSGKLKVKASKTLGPPSKIPNLEKRSREYLSVGEVNKLIKTAKSVHPHMLRHGKGYQLASEGVDTRAIQAYMGHKNIQHTVLYTQLNPKRFKGFGKDVKL